jgi:hypothetical protein
VWGRGEVPTEFWYGNVKKKDLVVEWRIILKWIFKD